MGGNSWQYRYDTGYLDPNGDWTNRHLGSMSTVDSYLNHRLNTHLPGLSIKLWVSSTTSDLDCVEVQHDRVDYGYACHEVDLNNVKVQTASSGLTYISDAGVVTLVPNTWNYKIKAWVLG